MWQDSGRYEWPLVGAPGEQTTAPDTRPYPEEAAAEIADLRRQVAELRAQVAQLEQAKPHGGTL